MAGSSDLYLLVAALLLFVAVGGGLMLTARNLQRGHEERAGQEEEQGEQGPVGRGKKWKRKGGSSAVERMKAGGSSLRRRRRLARDDDSDEGSANEGPSAPQGSGSGGELRSSVGGGRGDSDEEPELEERRGKKGLAREAKKAEQEARRAQSDARRKKQDAYLEKKRLKEEEREEREREEGERRGQEEEERQKKLDDEANKWLDLISVENTGSGENDVIREDQGLLQRFVDYIKTKKTVSLEDLAQEFGLKVQECINRVNGLEQMGRLSGVMDDRGKFIYISEEEMRAVADYLGERGRVSIAELARKSNEFIDLSAKQQQSVSAAASGS